MATRVAVMTDVHANLPALEAALMAIRSEGVEAVYHTGDAIGIGPFPAEVLDRLFHTPGVRAVMGNHDAWFAHGLPSPRPPWMSEGELAHQRWVHAQIDPTWRPVVAAWPWEIEEEVGGLLVAFVHYGIDPVGGGFEPIVPNQCATVLNRVFARQDARLVFYGHQHYPSRHVPDVVGRARYVNPGALGCGPAPVARFALLEVDRDGSHRVAFRSLPYNAAPLFRAFEERAVPERDFIMATFFGHTGRA